MTTLPSQTRKITQILGFLLFLLLLNGCSQPVTLDTPQIATDVAATLQMDESTPTLQVVPLETAASTPAACTSMRGKVVDKTIPSKLLHKPIAVKLYLPPCYSDSSTTRYPVLYMLHGQTYHDDQWVRIGITDKADQLIADKRILPLIIVMPQEDESTADPFTAKFGDAVVQEVIPWVDANLDTCAERDCRAIGGLSRGGNWAVRIGLTHPDLFAAIGAHSTPLFYGDLSQIATWVKAAPSLQAVPVLYVDMGKSDENRANILQFEQELSDLGVVHDFYQFIGFHEEKYWSAHVEGYLRWYSVHLSPGVNNQ